MSDNSPVGPGRDWRPSGHCAFVACDIVSFGNPDRTDHVQRHLRAAFYDRLRESFDLSGVPFQECYHEDRGDGVIVVIPSRVPTATLVSPLVDRLRAGLLRHNKVSSEVAQIRLRVALHTGEVEFDGHGIVGTDVNHVFRLLDGPAFKEAFKESSSCLGFLASEQVYDGVIRHAVDLIDPDEYRPIEIKLKETRTRGWMRLPGTGPAGAGIGQEIAPRDDTAAVAVDARVPATEKVMDGLPVRALVQIVDRLLDIPVMASSNGRDQVVAELRKEIAYVVPRQLESRMDAHCILRTCMDYPGGLTELVDVLRSFVGDSTPMRALERTIDRLLDG